MVATKSKRKLSDSALWAALRRAVQEPVDPALLPPPGGPGAARATRPPLPRPGDVAQPLTPSQQADLERRLAERRREIAEGTRKRPTKAPAFARGGVMPKRAGTATGRRTATTRTTKTTSSRSRSKARGGRRKR